MELDELAGIYMYACMINCVYNLSSMIHDGVVIVVWPLAIYYLDAVGSVTLYLATMHACISARL